MRTILEGIVIGVISGSIQVSIFFGVDALRRRRAMKIAAALDKAIKQVCPTGSVTLYSQGPDPLFMQPQKPGEN